MKVNQVDLFNRSITLDPGATKNCEGRTIKLTSETYEFVKQSIVCKNPSDFLISRRDGQQVKDFRASWKKLTEAAKLACFSTTSGAPPLEIWSDEAYRK